MNTVGSGLQGEYSKGQGFRVSTVRSGLQGEYSRVRASG